MKKGIIAIAGGLLVSATIIGCGGDTTELENKLKKAEQRTQLVADSISLEYQATVDSLQAVIDELTASTTTTPSSTTTGGGTKPKTEEPTKTTEESTKGSKLGGGSDKQDESTQTKGSKIDGGADNQDKATDKKKSKMGNP